MGLESQLEHEFVETGSVRLHVVAAGPAEGRLVVLLHGFPEFWYGWRHQVAPLAEAGFRVVAPDLRGYNLSDKPRGVAQYTIDRLADDVAGLIQALGRQRALLVGHDWGGAVAWWLSLRRPEVVERQVILNVPHGAVMIRHLRRTPRQLLRSWYMFLFQLPWLPEALFRLGNWRGAVRGLRNSSRPGTFSEDDLQRYRQAWSQPGAMTAMINWYRAAMRHLPEMPENLRVAAPTLLIWGKRDRFVLPELAEPSLALCDRGELVFIEEATHWVQHEEPERVNALIVEFLNRAS